MKVKQKLGNKASDDYDDIPTEGQEYVELSGETGQSAHSKITVRPFVLEDFADTKLVLDALREGYTIALVNIKPLKDQDLVELKRAINKLKKTTDAIEGDIAGFSEDWIWITPSFANVHRESRPTVPKMSSPSTFEEY